MATSVKVNMHTFNWRLTVDVANIFFAHSASLSSQLLKPLERLNYCEFKKKYWTKGPLGHTNRHILRDLNMLRVDNYYGPVLKRRSYLEVFTWAGSPGSLWHGATIPGCWIAPRNTIAGTF